MHCHLDFAADTAAAAREAAACLNAGFFANTMEPADFPGALAAFASCPNVHVGLGWHPWRVPEDRDSLVRSLALFDRFAAEGAGLCGPDASDGSQVRLFGEVGLDFAGAHAARAPQQRTVFSHVLDTAASRSGSVVSIHCVRAYDEALDMIELSGASQAGTCIFHWFSGTSDQLNRAVSLGCRFSVGERMLATKRGRAYAKAVPADRLLLETDLPAAPAEPCGLAGMVSSLERTLAALEELRADRLAEMLAASSAGLLR